MSTVDPNDREFILRGFREWWDALSEADRESAGDVRTAEEIWLAAASWAAGWRWE